MAEPNSTRYAEWISANVEGDGYGKCADVTLAMATAFPGLTRVRGHYYCAIWGERTHWWMVAPDGSIVDPTVAQFPSGSFGVYEPWIEGEKEPTGKCANCGGYCYDDSTVCSDACARSLERYLMTGIL